MRSFDFFNLFVKSCLVFWTDYESKLVSPMTKKRKIRHRKRPPKRGFPSLDLAKLPPPTDDKSGDADVSELEDDIGKVGWRSRFRCGAMKIRCGAVEIRWGAIKNTNS